MITDTSKFHGVVLINLIEDISSGILIRKLNTGINGIYLLNEKIPLYVKYASKRTSPWSFTLHSTHLQCYYDLAVEYGDCLMVLICGSDGIVTLGNSEMVRIIIPGIDIQKRITVTRRLKHMYSVNGSDGNIEKRISKKSLTEYVINTLNMGVAK
jgi:hypothetical protein